MDTSNYGPGADLPAGDGVLLHEDSLSPLSVDYVSNSYSHQPSDEMLTSIIQPGSAYSPFEQWVGNSSEADSYSSFVESPSESWLSKESPLSLPSPEENVRIQGEKSTEPRIAFRKRRPIRPPTAPPVTNATSPRYLLNLLVQIIISVGSIIYKWLPNPQQLAVAAFAR